MKDKIRETLAFEDLTQEEKEKRGILGRLYGPCASISVPTRNGRGYNESLWENVFNDKITKEMFANGGIPMEMDHPADREETDSSRIAAMMPEPPKKDDNGRLITYCDLIDTPMGRIAYQLAKYGFKLGISSRGSGDIIQDDEGNDIVDPDTYAFTTFDLVLLPAVEEARLTMTESLNTNTQMSSLKKALKEDLEHGRRIDGTEYSVDEKKIMSETLNDLGINLDDDSTSLNENVNIQSDNLNESVDESIEVINNESNEIIHSLKEALKTNAELEAKVKSLQEELAVSDTKVSNLEESISKSNSTIVRLTSIARESKALKEEVSNLENELIIKNRKLENLSKRPTRESLEVKKTLEESIAKKDEMIKSAKDEIKSLTEQLNNLKSSKESEVKSLQESLNCLQESLKEEKENSKKTITKLKESLNNKQLQLESCKKQANNIARYYINTKAKLIGVNSNEILNKLSDNYSLEEVDKICEDLKAYKIGQSKLPFNLEKNGVIRINESKNISMTESSVQSNDDYISDDVQAYVDRL